MTNWKQHIATLGLLKQRIMDADIENIWPHHLPEVAATKSKLEALEQDLGFKLDSQLRDFLRHANGWRGFYQTVDLFGTDAFTHGSKHDNASKMLLQIDDSVLKRGQLRRDTLLPIAATEEDLDIFVLVIPPALNAGIIIWIAGDEIQRFQNFEEYFLSMIEYNRRVLSRLLNRKTDS